MTKEITKNMVKELHIRLGEADYKIIENIKNETAIKTNNEVFKYIFDEYRKLQNEKEIFLNALKEHDEEQSEINIRNRFALRTAERNSIYILDILNTLLSTQRFGEFKGGLIPVDFSKHKLLIQSEEQLKSKIEHLKQVKDNRIL